MESESSYNLPVKNSFLWYAIFAVYIVYCLQGTLYQSGGIISMMLMLFILIVGAVNFARSVIFFRHTPACILLLAFFFILLTLAFIKSPMPKFSVACMDYISCVSQYRESCVFVLSAFTGYQIGLRKRIPDKQYLISTLILTAALCFLFYRSAARLHEIRGVEETTNNAAYSFLYLLPLAAILSIKYKRLAICLSAIVFIYVTAGAKRGAILCLILMLIYFSWWCLKHNYLSFRSFIILIILLVSFGLYFSYVFEESKYLQTRFEDTINGNSSGRDELFDDLVRHWVWEPDLQVKLLGAGTGETIPIAGNLAHNDWLELLIDNGILGVAVYALIFIYFIVFLRRRNIPVNIKLGINLWLVLWFAKTMFSMSYVSSMGGLSMMLLGVVVGNSVSEQSIAQRIKSKRNEN